MNDSISSFTRMTGVLGPLMKPMDRWTPFITLESSTSARLTPRLNERSTYGRACTQIECVFASRFCRPLRFLIALDLTQHKISPVEPGEYAERFFSFLKAVMRDGEGGERFKAD